MFHSKRIYTLILRICYKRYAVWKECPTFFLLSLLISSWVKFFPEISLKFNKSLKRYEFLVLLVLLNFFVNFLDFFTFTCYKTNDVSIYKIISAFFWLEIILGRSLKNFSKLYWYWISSSSNMKVVGSYWPTQNKLSLKNPALER